MVRLPINLAPPATKTSSAISGEDPASEISTESVSYDVKLIRECVGVQGSGLARGLLQSPAARATLHALILLLAGLGRRPLKTDAAIESLFDFPVLAIIGTGRAVAPPVDVVF